MEGVGFFIFGGKEALGVEGVSVTPVPVPEVPTLSGALWGPSGHGTWSRFQWGFESLMGSVRGQQLV